MKKSVAITTIVALHAAVIGMLLIQGCSSEPTAPQAGSAKATGEVVKEIPAATEVVAEPKEPKIPEGSMVLRENPTRPIETISNSGDVLVSEPVDSPKSDVINDDIKPIEPTKKVADSTLTIHSVKKGESLSSIAKKYKVSLSSLMKANNLNMHSKINIGQELDIPSTNGEVIPAPAKAEEMPAAPMTSEETSVYVVKKGDSLSRIAKNTHMTVAQLMSVNNLKNHNIKIGQKLQIVKGAKSVASVAEKSGEKKSGSGASAKASKKSAKIELKDGEVEHTIANGETLGGIAKKYGTSVSAIAERNSIKDPRKIRVGQVIVIGGKKVATAAKADVKKETKVEAPKTEAPKADVSSPIVVTSEQSLKVEEPKPVEEKVEVIAPTPATDATTPVVEL